MALRDNAIVAYAETKVMEKSDRDVWVLAGEILEELLDKTGIEKNEIDGLVMAGLTGTGAANPFWAQTTADVLGLEVGFCEQVHTGGCSAAGCVARAAAAIDYGMCEVAFLLFADTHVLEDRTDHSHSYRREWTDPYGLMGPPGAFGLLSRRYEAKYGLDYRMLGKLAVTQRNHALLNENACEKLRVPITIDDYMNSRMIADPIRLLDCVMRADGAAGLIMMSRKRAKEKGPDQDHHPDRLCRADQLQGRREPGRRDQERSRNLRQEGARRGRRLGIKDIASFHPYDDFIIAIMLQFEAFGFCKRAKACRSSATMTSPTTAICRSTPAAARFPPARRPARRTTSAGRSSWQDRGRSPRSRARSRRRDWAPPASRRAAPAGAARSAAMISSSALRVTFGSTPRSMSLAPSSTMTASVPAGTAQSRRASPPDAVSPETPALAISTARPLARSAISSLAGKAALPGRPTPEVSGSPRATMRTGRSAAAAGHATATAATMTAASAAATIWTGAVK